jgi:diguanylate cyclase (GGDEF)-like protein
MMEFSQQLAVLDVDRLVEILKKKLPHIFGIELFSVFSLEEGVLSLVATNNPKIVKGTPVSFKLESSPLMKEAAEAGKPIIVEDFSKSKFASGKQDNYTDEFAISVPIMRDKEVIGIINMNGNRLGFFDNPDLTFVRLGVELLSGALSNAMQHRQIQQLAITDGQTGLYNNRYFYKVLGEEWEKVVRYTRHFSLIIVDIDFFKKVNDTHGHLTGDRVLNQLSKILTHEARKVDTVARYGGEEFTILLPETLVEKARNVAERMRTAVEANVFEGVDVTLSITASFGVADSRNSDFQKGEDIIKTADERLYRAKESGRNRVIAED